MSEPRSGGLTPLRVGVLVDSFVQPRWIAWILEAIQSSQCAEIVLTIRNVAQLEGRNLAQRLSGKRRTLLYDWYSKWDDAKHRYPDDALSVRDLESLFTAAQVLDVLPRMTRHTDRIEGPDIQRIREYDLDVLLRFGFRLIRGDIFESARYGIWSYHHGDNQRYRGGPPYFWEVAEGRCVAGSVLQVINEELDGGRVIYRAYSRAALLSVRRTRQECYGTAQQFVMRKLQDVYHRGEEGLKTHTDVQPTWKPYSQRLYVAPTNRQMLRFLGIMVGRRLRAKWTAIFKQDQWVLAYQFDPRYREAERDEGEFLPSPVFHRSKSIIPPPGRMWADPFPLRVDGRFYLLFEDWPSNGGRGHIAVVEWDENGRWSEPVIALTRPYHLSYPHVFRWNGEIYMTPETAEVSRIELYRATSFPLEWTLERVLVEDLPAYDPTLVQWDGRWWMFTTVRCPGESSSTELHLFFADSPLGPWTAHPLNPVKSDIRSARPAGRPFSVDGTLYRPAQDCSVRYGYAVALNRIEQLSETEYREVVVAWIDAKWLPGLVASHTINADHGLTVLDGQMRVLRFGRWLRAQDPRAKT